MVNIFLIFFRKPSLLRDNVEKYGMAGQVIADNIARRMRFACWMPRATYTHTEYAIVIAFTR